MKRTMLNLLALALIAGGGAHLAAQETTPGSGGGDEPQLCCTSGSGKTCCGYDRCRAGISTCCADKTCD